MPAAFTLGCVALAFAGVVLVATRGDPGAAIAGGELAGDLLVFCGAVSWLTYTLAGAWKFAGWSPLRMTVLTCIPGTVGLIAANAIAVLLDAARIPTLASVAGAAVVIGALVANNLYLRGVSTSR